jgi:polysaccharide export outer membrane protein
MRILMQALILLATICGAMLIAQTQTRAGNPQGPMAEAGGANLPGARVGPDDLIAVSVYDSPELTRTLRVDPNGFLTLPLVRTKLKAAGLTPADLEKSIAAVLRDEGILVSPVVLVTMVEYHSRPVSVVGAVKKPLTFQAAGRVTLLDALARAEGLSSDAAPAIVVTREAAGAAPGQAREVVRVAVRDLIDLASPEANLELHGGEEIRVPEAQRVFVVGNVKKPGAFPVREGTPITVLKALALAEGLSPFSDKLAFIYRHQGSGQDRKEIPVEIGKLVQRKTPDVDLLADDVLYIPENKGRRTTATLLEKTAGFGLATASGVLVWRR